MKGLPPIPNYLEQLKNVIAMLQETPGFEIEDLGEREIGDRMLIGFRAKHPKVDITMWADPVTALPVLKLWGKPQFVQPPAVRA